MLQVSEETALYYFCDRETELLRKAHMLFFPPT